MSSPFVDAPRVLMLGAFLSGTSATRAVSEDIRDRLRARGWTVLDASSRSHPVARLADSLAITGRQRSAYDVAHVDVFSGRSFRIAQACGALLRRLDKPYLATLHGGGLPAMAKASPGPLRQLLQGATHVLSPSPFLQRELAPLRSDVEVVPNPIELSLYPFRVRDLARSEGPVRLLWLRAFAAIYRPEDAVHALGRLLERGVDAHLELVGPDKGDGTLERVSAAARDFGERIRILSDGVAKSAVPELLDRSDVLLNTTSVDNTPVTLLEAMAAGTPIVSTRAGGVPDLVQHESTALLVDVAQPAQIADAVHRLQTEEGLAIALGRQAYEAVQEFDWSRVLPRWESLLLASAGCRSAA